VNWSFKERGQNVSHEKKKNRFCVVSILKEDIGSAGDSFKKGNEEGRHWPVTLKGKILEKKSK